jgi:hypothetical protein
MTQGLLRSHEKMITVERETVTLCLTRRRAWHGIRTHGSRCAWLQILFLLLSLDSWFIFVVFLIMADKAWLAVSSGCQVYIFLCSRQDQQRQRIQSCRFGTTSGPHCRLSSCCPLLSSFAEENRPLLKDHLVLDVGNTHLPAVFFADLKERSTLLHSV